MWWFCMGRKGLDGLSRKCGVTGNCMSILIYGGCKWFAYVWEGSENGKNVFVCVVRWDNKLLHV